MKSSAFVARRGVIGVVIAFALGGVAASTVALMAAGAQSTADAKASVQWRVAVSPGQLAALVESFQ